jgi:hypothetical protein
MNVQHLCWYCDTPLEQSDNPFYSKWKHTNATEISNLVLEGEVMSYHCFLNGFSGIKFADPIRGINGATPAERLHLLNHGLFQIILEYNFGQKRAKAVHTTIRKILRASPDAKEDDDTESTDNSDPDEDETNNERLKPHFPNDDQTLSNVALFTPSICDRFDWDAKEYGRFLQKQSCCYWKCSFFIKVFLPIQRGWVMRKETVCCCVY